jgi:hypothetical protein
MSDCEMVRACTDEEHGKMVDSVLLNFERKRDDPRHYYNRLIGVRLGIAEFSEVDCDCCGGRGTRQLFELLRRRAEPKGKP